MTIKFSIEAKGLKELQKELKRLPEELSASFVKSAMLKAVEPVLQEARRRAPVDSGRLQLMQAKSAKIMPRAGKILIRVGTKFLGKRQITKSLEKKAAGKSKGTVLTHNAYYDFMVEYGTRFQKAQPYLRPAFDGKKEEFVAVFREQVRVKLDAYYKKFPSYRPS